MRVKLLTNLGSNDFPDLPLMEGEVHDLPEQTGIKLVKLRLAAEVPPEPKPIEAVAMTTNEDSTPDRFAAERSKGKQKHPSK